MRIFAQLTADEQQRAIDYQLGQLSVDPAFTADPVIASKLQTLALKRARAAFYLDPDDQLVTLPPATTTTPTV